MTMRNIAQASAAGAVVWLALILLAVAVLTQVRHQTDGCTWLPNHSGVMECHVGPYDGWLPVDTTNGGDIVL